LGFQARFQRPKSKHVALDPATIPRIKDVPHIPPLGPVFNTWMQEKDLLRYKDPVYTALLEESSHGVENLVKAAIKSTGKSNIIISLLGSEPRNSWGTLTRVQKQMIKEGNSCWLAGDTPSGMILCGTRSAKKKRRAAEIRYQGQRTLHLGLTSLASRVQKPKVSELTLHVKCIGKGRHLAPSPHESSNGLHSTSNSASAKLSSLQPSEKKLSTSGASNSRILSPAIRN
jgi:hypothetical protein